MTNHILKIEKKWMARIESGEKKCEIRKDDRDFQKGDYIKFSIKDEDGKEVGISGTYEITHVLNFGEGMREGYVALSIKTYLNK